MKWISYLLVFLKVLINFGLMMKDEWLTFYSRFLATETVDITQLKSNSAAVLQFRSWSPIPQLFSNSATEVQFRSCSTIPQLKNLIVQFSLTFSYKIRFWWFKYRWKGINKIYTVRNPSLKFETVNNEINCWKEATFNLRH